MSVLNSSFKWWSGPSPCQVSSSKAYFSFPGPQLHLGPLVPDPLQWILSQYHPSDPSPSLGDSALETQNPAFHNKTLIPTGSRPCFVLIKTVLEHITMHKPHMEKNVSSVPSLGGKCWYYSVVNRNWINVKSRNDFSPQVGGASSSVFEEKTWRNPIESNLAPRFTEDQRAGSQVSGNRRADSELHGLVTTQIMDNYSSG